MAIYIGQVATINDVPFARAGELIAVGRNGDYDVGATTLARKHDLIAPLELHGKILGSSTTDSGRLVADRRYKAFAVCGDPDSMLARIETGKILQRLHPDYSIHLDFGAMMNLPESRGPRHAERR